MLYQAANASFSGATLFMHIITLKEKEKLTFKSTSKFAINP